MGYETYYTGEARITGGILSEDTLAQEGWLEAGAEEDFFIITTDGDPDDVQVVNGELTVVAGTQFQNVTMRYEERIKGYNFDERVQMLLDKVLEVGGEIHGHFRGDGEEDGDIWRIRFTGTDKVSERPKLVWPNGDEDQL